MIDNPFSDKLNALLDAKGVPPINQGRVKWFHNYVKKELKIDITHEAVRKWISGEPTPKTSRIGQIAKGLGSTAEYLIGTSDLIQNPREENNNNNNKPYMEVKEPGFLDVTDYEYGLIQLYRQLPEAQQEMIRVTIVGLINECKSSSRKKAKK